MVDTDVESWYWEGLETASLLEAGLLTLDDIDWAEYTLSQEIANARRQALTARAEQEAKRKRK